MNSSLLEGPYGEKAMMGLLPRGLQGSEVSGGL